MCVGDFMDKIKKIKPRKEYIIILLITILGIVLDQISKIFIRYEFTNLSCVNCLPDILPVGGVYNGFNVVPKKGIEIIKNFFYITNVKNTGGAWGMFSGNVSSLALISAIVVLILIYFLKEERKLNKISITYYGIMFAGIIGNLIDRLFLGYVTDFFNFYIFGYDYPVFNIADILIVLGIILMIVDVVRGEIHAYKKRKR
jgi:signal peptidase II